MSAPQAVRDHDAEAPRELTPAAESPVLRAPGGGRRFWLVPIVLVVATAGLFVANHRHEADAAAADPARTVVTDHVKSLLTYSHQDIDQDLAAEKGWLTGPFSDRYADLVSTKIGPAARKAKVTTSAAITSSGVVTATHDHVELLLFVNVTTRSSELREPRVSGSRLLVTADLVGGEWRISALDPV